MAPQHGIQPELVPAYLNCKGGYKTIARKCDISRALLIIWVEKCRNGELTDEVQDAERIREYEAKGPTFERTVGPLVMDRTCLKKKRGTAGRCATVGRLRAAGSAAREASYSHGRAD